MPSSWLFFGLIFTSRLGCGGYGSPDTPHGQTRGAADTKLSHRQVAVAKLLEIQIADLKPGVMTASAARRKHRHDGFLKLVLAILPETDRAAQRQYSGQIPEHPSPRSSIVCQDRGVPREGV